MAVRVQELRDISEFRAASRLFNEIWQPDPDNPPVTVELMKAFTHAGNYVSGAYDERDQLVGASVGFLAAPPGQALHSHVTGAAHKGAGFALKLHQRAWALERGIDRITWTYDPLVRRNAYFNLVKLGARPEQYLPEFYGAMADAINAGDESDRALAVWRLSDPRVVRAAAGETITAEVPADAVPGILEKGDRPLLGPCDGRVVLVAVPGDIEGLRTADPAAALDWRHAVRQVLGGLMRDGARVTGFDQGRYIVER
ncbi:GNAT family N-acetyltransferase [Streptosporangiaceae bacterium NEAU-GS5]|nr:GNAT family N-acetyltransferase [Streptosporangiaceae bacterium NEAU-GS5]